MKTIALICTHNGEQFIEEQIDSILKQTIKLDSIIIDDYSSQDLTLEIVQKYSKNYKNIQFNSYDMALGPGHSFLNSINSIRENQGNDYILYLVDQDDIWLPDKNENVLKEFYNSEPAIIFHDVEIVNEKLLSLKKSYYGSYWSVPRDLKFPNQLYSNCVIGHTCALSSKFIKQINLEYDNRIPMHDWHLINEALFLKQRVIFLERVLSLYRQHDKNILGASRNKKNNLFKSLIRHHSVLKGYHEFLEEKYPEIVKQYGLNNPFTILKYIRPIKKLITIFIVKFYFTYDTFRLLRTKQGAA